ncbi:6-hydroxytryprostatin B O-methyltransferase [Cyphellophora attinorum]|uniref:6-hydroxytryprostatin B O-methyltransferase n=1 Tax=Cyphellophora attinorum TaxID=1664694 RepID=A0A0N0NIY6_9EURO|nr:6-hydroxytryprostatin B O-methyltransferase [Phialophora attinorum]KPI35989.1 6-hydroxytryprostatin B O-methyltransferase [Phialophora attinorum]
MAITYPTLSNYETLAANALIDAGVLSQHVNVAGGDAAHEAKIGGLRTKLFESAQALLQAVTPPEYTLTQGLSASIMDLTVFRYISWYEVAEGVPTDHPISYIDLAIILGVDPVQLKRILRYAMTKHVFTETLSGQVAHTDASLLLLQDGIATMNRYSTNRGFPIAASFNDAIEKWGHGAQEANQTAFNIAFNTKLPLFDHLATDPAYARDFHHVMKFFSKTPPMSIDHIRSAFDWKSLPANATVVDIDLPEVVAQGTDPITSTVPRHLASRISFQPHSLWDVQPQRSADAYFMRMIFHDWPQKYAVKILRQLVAGMRAGARLLIMDYVTLEPGKLEPVDEKRVRMRDLQMMIMHNALERDVEEWTTLLVEADERLRLVGITTPAGSALSILEIVLDASPALKITPPTPATETAPGDADHVTDEGLMNSATSRPESEAADQTSPRSPDSFASLSSTNSTTSSQTEPTAETPAEPASIASQKSLTEIATSIIDEEIHGAIVVSLNNNAHGAPIVV